LTPSPILKVLSTIRRNGVRSLLMGGQACVLYGGAEFSRDTDIMVVSDAENLARLQAAVDELQAEVIAVPPFDRRFLQAGHAVHFRCRIPEAAGTVSSAARSVPAERGPARPSIRRATARTSWTKGYGGEPWGHKRWNADFLGSPLREQGNPGGPHARGMHIPSLAQRASKQGALGTVAHCTWTVAHPAA
jgi:hypothetical protein